MISRLLERHQRAVDSDSGIALVTVILWVLAVTAISSIVAVSGVMSLRTTTADRAATLALGTTDAGVAEALSYIRTQSMATFTCTEPVNPTVSTWNQIAGCGYNVSGYNHWVNPFSPQIVAGGKSVASCNTDTECYQVWIGTLQKYQPPRGDQGQPGSTPATPEVLRVHSTGFSGTGPGARAVTVDVTVTPAHFPIGVFSQSNFTQQSSHIPISNESLFLPGNVTKVDCPLTGIDLAYNIPAAIHAGGVIKYHNGSCHMRNPNVTNPCLTTDPYDQDSNGIALNPGDACYNRDQTDPQFASIASTINAYPQTTYFNANSLANYGYQPGGLTPSEYASLKEIAQSEGTYNSGSLKATLTNLVAAGVTNPVVYFDNGHGPSLQDFPSQFTRTASAATVPGQTDTSGNACTAYAVVVVVRGAVTVHFTAGDLVGSVFIPDPGSLMRFDGNGTVIGTLFANSIEFEGQSPHFTLDQCFVASPPSGLTDLTTYNYNGTDVGNLQ